MTVTGKTSKQPWLSPDKTCDERVASLLAEMSLPEKVGQLTQFPELYEKDAPVVREGRVGSSILANSEFAGHEREKTISVATLNALQDVAVKESRLGIPILFARDIIHGLRTVFPVPLAQAASFSPGLVERAAAVAAREARSVGVAWTFAPILDVARDPRWGRIVEGYGEDPHLASALGAAAVRGFQGDDMADPERLMACAKHLAAYGAVEGGRDYNTADVSERTLRDVYLPSFHAAVDAGIGSVMTSYNDIAGAPCVCNGPLLSGILREEWDFEGLVISDWATVQRLLVHGVAADEDEAVRRSLEAGCDMDMCAHIYERRVARLVEDGVLSVEAVDRAVARVLRAKFLLGLFENPYTDTDRAAHVVMCSDHVTAAREVARKCIVLLRNEDKLLPLAKSVERLALLGPLARGRAELNGSWSADGVADDVVTLEAGIRAAVSDGTEVTVTDGSRDEMVRAAKEADVAILVAGEDHERSGENRNVSSLDLPGDQEGTLRAVVETGTPTVLVVIAGRPLAITWAAGHVPAVLYAWQPGMQGGHAIADVLFGDENPAARLPVTFPRTAGQIPIYHGLRRTGVGEDGDPLKHSPYLDVQGDPLYVFGYGLGYTRFEYTDLQVSPGSFKPGGSVTVSAKVTNAGERAGEEVVQLYAQDRVADVSRPMKELKGFERIALEAGETRTVAFTLSAPDLAYTHGDMSFGADPGRFTVWIGPNSDEGQEGTFTLEE